MMRNGKQSDSLAWGEPRSRPFKGFLVRWFEWVNTTWPHREHSLYNGARDASSLSTIVPCLHSHVPPQTDLVIVEAGSMFLSHKPPELEELILQLISSSKPRAVAFVTVHVWCTFGGSQAKKTNGFGMQSLETCIRGPLDPRGRRCVYHKTRTYRTHGASMGRCRQTKA